MRRVCALLIGGVCAASITGCSLVDDLKNMFGATQTPAPEPSSFATYEVSDAPAETVSPVNLTAVQNFAGVWNMNLAQAPSLELVPSEAVAHPADGMLSGGQILEYTFPPGQLYLYVVEGQLVGARMTASTNNWGEATDPRDFSVCWKTMVQSVNGNWVDGRYVDLIVQISDGFPPPGQETGTLEGPAINDAGWVYQMNDYDLGYCFEKEVSAWVSHFAGADA